jgi:preprotein translocase subunit SecE
MLASFGGIVAKSKRRRNVNPVVAYFRSTRAELRKVRWPTLEQGWSMTKIVLVVTFGMAIFLGVLDFFFGWLLGQVVTGSAIFIVLGILVVVAMLAAAYFIGQGEEV